MQWAIDLNVTDSLLLNLKKDIFTFFKLLINYLNEYNIFIYFNLKFKKI